MKIEFKKIFFGCWRSVEALDSVGLLATKKLPFPKVTKNFVLIEPRSSVESKRTKIGRGPQVDSKI